MSAIHRHSGLDLLPLLGLLVVAVVVATLLPMISIPWTLKERGQEIPRDLEFTSHARTSHSDKALNAECVYKKFLEGSCTAEAKFCSTHPIHGARELYLCQDPVSGLVGFLIVELERWNVPKILTGYGVKWIVDPKIEEEYLWSKIFIKDFWGEEGSEWHECP